MKANLKPGGGDGPGGEELRSFLRHWVVPGPPPEIEEGLRRTFRRRRAKGRPALWIPLATAAALALLAVWRIGMKDRPVAPAPAERTVAVATPAPPAPAAVGPAPPPSAPAPGRPYAAVSAARPSRRPTPAPPEAEIVVEPGQAQGLAELGRRLRDVLQGVPGTTVPRVETLSAAAATSPIPAVGATDVPVYQAEWGAVAGEWPFVHQSVPTSGR